MIRIVPNRVNIPVRIGNYISCIRFMFEMKLEQQDTEQITIYYLYRVYINLENGELEDLHFMGKHEELWTEEKDRYKCSLSRKFECSLELSVDSN